MVVEYFCTSGERKDSLIIHSASCVGSSLPFGQLWTITPNFLYWLVTQFASLACLSQ